MRNRNERRVETLTQGVAILLRTLEQAKTNLRDAIADGDATSEVLGTVFPAKLEQRISEVRKAVNITDENSELQSMQSAHA